MALCKKGKIWRRIPLGHYRKSHSAVPLSVPQQRTFANGDHVAKCHEMTFAAGSESDVLSSGADDFRYLARASRIGESHIVDAKRSAVGSD